METAIIVALISLAGSLAVAVLNFVFQQRVRAQEERVRQTKEQVNQQGEQVKQQGEQVKQQGEQLVAQQKAINTLVAYTMSASIFRHLCGITLLYTYNLDLHEANRRELYFLRDHGFI